MLHVLADVPISIEVELIAALFDAIQWFPESESG